MLQSSRCLFDRLAIDRYSGDRRRTNVSSTCVSFGCKYVVLFFFATDACTNNKKKALLEWCLLRIGTLPSNET